MRWTSVICVVGDVIVVDSRSLASYHVEKKEERNWICGTGIVSISSLSSRVGLDGDSNCLVTKLVVLCPQSLSAVLYRIWCSSLSLSKLSVRKGWSVKLPTAGSSAKRISVGARHMSCSTDNMRPVLIRSRLITLLFYKVFIVAGLAFSCN